MNVNVNKTGTKYFRIMKQTAFWREKKESIRGLFKKYRALIFPAKTNQAREVSIIVEVEGTFIRMREYFPAYRKRQ